MKIYNLVAQSHDVVSFEEPEFIAKSDALGELRFLGAICVHNELTLIIHGLGHLCVTQHPVKSIIAYSR